MKILSVLASMVVALSEAGKLHEFGPNKISDMAKEEFTEQSSLSGVRGIQNPGVADDTNLLQRLDRSHSDNSPGDGAGAARGTLSSIASNSLMNCQNRIARVCVVMMEYAQTHFDGQVHTMRTIHAQNDELQETLDNLKPQVQVKELEKNGLKDVAQGHRQAIIRLLQKAKFCSRDLANTVRRLQVSNSGSNSGSSSSGSRSRRWSGRALIQKKGRSGSSRRRVEKRVEKYYNGYTEAKEQFELANNMMDCSTNMDRDIAVCKKKIAGLLEGAEEYKGRYPKAHMDQVILKQDIVHAEWMLKAYLPVRIDQLTDTIIPDLLREIDGLNANIKECIEVNDDILEQVNSVFTKSPTKPPRWA